ncbi:MAG: hypothetical protein V7L26_15070 [Nostoc sp.]|uniref:hypothetical protein n=1 Tax=Nostoc sp. TaxID=1180 RepID=UPI002FEEE37C
MEKLYRPTFINFSLWASDPDNEGLLQIFYYVCSVINPLIGVICNRFGYAGYLSIVASLILFFSDSFGEDRESANDLITIFSSLHDAGAAATTLNNPTSKRFLKCLDEITDFRDITPDFIANSFPISDIND